MVLLFYRRVVIVLDITVLASASDVGTTIGNPQAFKIGETAPTPAPAPAAEPPRKLQRLSDNGEWGGR
jgi:hypothetical protein